MWVGYLCGGQRRAFQISSFLYCVFWGLNTSYQACPESALTHWTISQAMEGCVFKCILLIYALYYRNLVNSDKYMIR